MEDLEYRPLKMEVLEVYGKGYCLELYLKLTSKYIKVTQPDTPIEDIVLKYHAKGVEELYVTGTVFEEFKKSVRLSLMSLIKGKDSSEEDGDIPDSSFSEENKAKTKALAEEEGDGEIPDSAYSEGSKIEVALQGIESLLDPADEDSEELAEEEIEDEEALKAAEKLSAGHSLFKEMFTSGELDEEAKKMSQALTKATVRIVNGSRVFNLFDRFKSTCSHEYFIALSTSYIACCMIDQFSWGKRPQKEKVSMAALLVDIALGPEEFEELKKHKNRTENLSSKILNHPIDTAKKLEKDSKFISAETLTIIEQHHEKPNGKGFPKSVSYQAITALTAVYIVAHH
ncbi:MAG: HD domain-containing protein, partial [Halobacteriovoraceae bacterium]|nr:HD domain-containing protein [Halobacteriovoraceae bacterium]